MTLLDQSNSMQVAATSMHHKALQLQPPTTQAGSASDKAQHQHPGESKPQGQAPAALPLQAASSPQHGSDRTSKMAVRATELAVKREDAELSHRADSERRNLPSNVDGFK